MYIPASSSGSNDDYKKMTAEKLSSNIRDAITNKFWTNYSDCKREVKWKTEEHRIGPAPRDEWKGNKIRYFYVNNSKNTFIVDFQLNGDILFIFGKNFCPELIWSPIY